MIAILCEGHRPSDALARGVGPPQDPRAKCGHSDGNGGYASGMPQTKRLNQFAQVRELLFCSDQVPAVEAPLHLDVVCQRQVLRAVLRVLALALRKVEYVVGDRRGAGVVARGEKSSPCSCCLSNKLGKVSDLLGEDPDARCS